MDCYIKEEPVFEEGNGHAGDLSVSLISIGVKKEDGTCTSETSLNGPSGMAIPENRRHVKLEESSTIYDAQNPEAEDEELEESLSDEGIGRSPTASDYVVQSTSEEEVGMCSTSAVDPRKELLLNSLEKHLFCCKVCGMAFTDEIHLSHHMKKHIFLCQFCSKEFSSDLELLQHEEIHREGKEYTCDECNIIFDSKALLEKHYAEHIYACSHCPKTFTNEFALSNHERCHGASDINCDDCGKKFTRLSNLTVHKQKHCQKRKTVGIVQSKALQGSAIDRKPVKSSIVNSKSDYVIGKSAHERGSDMYFHCSQCPKAFSNEADFARHKLGHQVENTSVSLSQSSLPSLHETSTNGFECKDCATTYPTIEALQSHYLKHKYPCDHCNMTFTNMKKLKSHLNSHDQIYSCPQCEREYKKLHYLEAHMIKEHSDGLKTGAHKISTSSIKAPSFDAREKLLVQSRSSASLQNTKNPASQVSFHLKESPDKRNLVRREDNAHSPQGSLPERHSVYTCRICKKSFWRKCDLTMHMKRGKHPVLTKCSDMNLHPPNQQEPFDSGENNVQDSIMTETQNDKFQCKLCSKVFARNSDLSRHKNLKHRGMVKEMTLSPIAKSTCVEFRCPSCPKTYDNKSALSLHIKRGRHLDTSQNGNDAKNVSESGIHSKPFRCTKCPKAYDKGFRLTEHLKLLHPDEWRRKQAITVQTVEKSNILEKSKFKEFWCSICAKSFSRKCDLTRHMKRGKHVTHHTISGRKTETPSHKKCSSISAQADLLQGKKLNDVQIPEFPCQFCSKVFARKRYLSRHMRVVHSKPFKCTECPKAYRKNFHLTEHFKLKHSNKLSRKQSLKLPPSIHSNMSCKICSKNFSTKYALTVHMKLGKHENSATQCSICFQNFKQKRYLLPHMRRCHGKELKGNHSEEFSCPLCPKTYTTKSCLKRHFEDKHPDGNWEKISSTISGHWCNACSNFFPSRMSFCEHTLSKHCKFYGKLSINEMVNKSKEEGLYCRICEKRFQRQSDLTRHMRIGKHVKLHQQGKLSNRTSETVRLDRIFKCSDCSAVHSTNSMLQRHIRTKHPNRKQTVISSSTGSTLRCKECSQTFSRQFDLKAHFRLKHRRGVLKRNAKLKISKKSLFSCEMCKQVFSERRYLARHRLKHQNYTKLEFRCTKCQIGFTKRCYLMRHMNQHHELTKKVSPKSNMRESGRYKCSMCPHSYFKKSSLRMHLSKKHPLHQCEMCLKSFACHRYLRVHLKKRHPELLSEEPRPHIKKMNQKYAIQRKKASEAQKKQALDSSPAFHQCPHCPKMFTSAFSLTTHLKLGKHTGSQNERRIVDSNSQGSELKKTFMQCEKCPRLFARKCDLTLHMKYGHQTEDQVNTYFQCPNCPVTCSSSWNLRKHMKRKHNSLTEIALDTRYVKVSSATKCSKSFLRHEDISKRVCKQQTQQDQSRCASDEGSSGSKVFRCSKCTQFFRKEILLERHMDSKHTQSESEDVSDQERSEASFEEAGTVSEELCAVAQASDEGGCLKTAWKCSECGKQFAGKSELTRHQDTHVCMCSYCNRFFTTRKSLEEHDCPQKKPDSVRHHSARHQSKPKKPNYNCGLCSKSFLCIKELESHQEKHTLDEEDQDYVTTINAGSEEPESNSGIPERFLTCRVCSKVFTSLEAVHNHEWSHFS